MDFSYEKNGKVETFSVNAGEKWDSNKHNCEYMNTIFQNLDDGDNIISQLELDTLNRVFKSNDKNNDGILQDNETNNNFYTVESLKELKAKVNVAETLYNDIFAKTSLGFPTTGKNMSSHLKAVNKDNVVEVMLVYQDKTNGKESLISGIMREYGLGIDTRVSHARYIFNQLCAHCKEKGVYTDDLCESFEKELKKQKDSYTPARAKNLDRIVEQLLNRSPERPETADKNVAPNGVIDADFSQGRIGDCWLLASIKALANSPKGLKILNDSISVNKDGSVTVKLKGVGKTYTFSKEEIGRNSHLSTGDLDVRAIEMAVNKYITEEGPVHYDEVDISGNTAFFAYKILTGKTCKHFWPYESNGDRDAHPERYGNALITDEMINNFNTPNHIATVAARRKSNKEKVSVECSNSGTGILVCDHEYAVIRSDSEYVYLINPWDTSAELKVDRKTFKQFFDMIYEFDL